MLELFQKWTDPLGKNLIITMGDSYLEVLSCRFFFFPKIEQFF